MMFQADNRIPVPARCRRPLAALAVLIGASVVIVPLVSNRGTGASGSDRQHRSSSAASVQHPNLSRLRHEADGREVLLIGTLPLDLDGTSRCLVSDALAVLKPDVVMVEGTPMAGMSAMVLSGQWRLPGFSPPNFTERANIGDAPAVTVVVEKKRRGFLGMFGGSEMQSRTPQQSIVPVKVNVWAHHLMSAVGGDVAEALGAAASSGVPVLWLGPDEGSFQGHMQVALLAEQAVRELLEEEAQIGVQMPSVDVDAALLSAENRIREDAARWLLDARGQTARMTRMMADRLPPQVRDQLDQKLRSRAFDAAKRIVTTMGDYSTGAVVISVDQLVSVEEMLLRNGFRYVADRV